MLSVDSTFDRKTSVHWQGVSSQLISKHQVVLSDTTLESCFNSIQTIGHGFLFPPVCAQAQYGCVTDRTSVLSDLGTPAPIQSGNGVYSNVCQ